MNDPDRYPVEVFWSDEDEGFIAIAPDLPGCSAFGADEAAALAELKHAISAWKEAAVNAGNPVPPPSRPAAAADYSGKFVLRMAKTMHRQLAQAAEREGVSLNQYVITLLATFNGLGTLDVILQQARSGYGENQRQDRIRLIECKIASHYKVTGASVTSGPWEGKNLIVQTNYQNMSDVEIVPGFVNDPLAGLPFSPIYVSEAFDG